MESINELVYALKNDVKEKDDMTCPECGSPMIPTGNCFYCNTCGYSPCSL